jgi:hypothetical protein
MFAANDWKPFQSCSNLHRRHMLLYLSNHHKCHCPLWLNPDTTFPLIPFLQDKDSLNKTDPDLLHSSLPHQNCKCPNCIHRHSSRPQPINLNNLKNIKFLKEPKNWLFFCYLLLRLQSAVLSQNSDLIWNFGQSSSFLDWSHFHNLVRMPSPHWLLHMDQSSQPDVMEEKDHSELYMTFST